MKSIYLLIDEDSDFAKRIKSSRYYRLLTCASRKSYEIVVRLKEGARIPHNMGVATFLVEKPQNYISITPREISVYDKLLELVGQEEKTLVEYCNLDEEFFKSSVFNRKEEEVILFIPKEEY